MELKIETYLKAESVDEGAIGEILNEGEYREQNFGTDEKPDVKTVFDIKVKVGLVEFAWTMNETTQRNLATKWGGETKAWIGKRVKFKKVQQNVFGEIKDVLYADPVVEAV